MISNEKYVKWQVKDYFRTFALFLGQAVILVAILLGILLSNFQNGGVEEFFTLHENLVYGVYCILTVVLLLVIIFNLNLKQIPWYQR